MNPRHKLCPYVRADTWGRIKVAGAIAVLTMAQAVLAAPADIPQLGSDLGESKPMMLAQASNRAEGRAMVQLMSQLDGLNREMSKLRGKIEELSNSIQNAEKRQKDMYLDLDTRLRRMEASDTKAAARSKSMLQTLSALQERVSNLEQSGSSSDAMSSQPSGNSDLAIVTTTPASSNDDVDATRAYEQAMSKYRANKFQDAIDAFQALVQQYPKHSLAINAQYWTGDAYYQLRAYRSAIDAHEKLIATYPNSEKTPDSMLNIGSAHLGLGDADATRKIWERLVAEFPTSQAAGKASARLKRLR